MELLLELCIMGAFYVLDASVLALDCIAAALGRLVMGTEADLLAFGV